VFLCMAKQWTCSVNLYTCIHPFSHASNRDIEIVREISSKTKRQSPTTMNYILMSWERRTSPLVFNIFRRQFTKLVWSERSSILRRTTLWKRKTHKEISLVEMGFLEWNNVDGNLESGKMCGFFEVAFTTSLAFQHNHYHCYTVR
jgi:hypothetical protein